LIEEKRAGSEESPQEELKCQEDDDVAHLDFPFSFYVLFPRLYGAKNPPPEKGEG
jgi:hypothetical protein